MHITFIRTFPFAKLGYLNLNWTFFYFIFIFIGLLENKKLTTDSLMGLFIYNKVYLSIIN
jgi:hypothetical protein